MTGPKPCTSQQSVCTVIDNITLHHQDCPRSPGTALAASGDWGELTLTSPALSVTCANSCMRRGSCLPSRQGASVSLRPRLLASTSFLISSLCAGALAQTAPSPSPQSPPAPASDAPAATAPAPSSPRPRRQRRHLRHPALARDSRRPPPLRTRGPQKRAHRFRPSRLPRRSLSRRGQNRCRQDHRRKSRRQRSPARRRLTRPALPMWPEERRWCRSWRAR